MKKKLLAALLAVCLVMSLLPAGALAAGAFNDVPDGHWGKSSIERWAGYGVLNGMGDGSFNPDAEMKRGEFAKMLCELMGYTKTAPNTFDDVPGDAWFAEPILKLVAAGVMNGVGDGLADPNGTVTREQAAVMLCRAFKIDTSSSGGSSFSDAGQISDWASGAVAALYGKGMINGVGDNTFAPKLEINRASVAKLADNMIGAYVVGSETISGEVRGFVVVKAGNAEVKFEDAKVQESIMVSPVSESASLELKGGTTAGAVVLSAPQAKVEIGEGAEVAGNVTVDAPKAEATVAGKAGKLEVTPEAEDAKASVAENGEVGSLENGSGNADVAVNGKAGNVVLSGKDSSVKAGENADVGNVEIQGDGNKFEADSKANVGKIEVGEDATNATVIGNNVPVENNSKEPVSTGNGQTIDPGKTDDAKPDVNTPVGPGGPSTPSYPSGPVVPAPDEPEFELKVSASSTDLYVDGDSMPVDADAYPSADKTEAATWTSSDETIATVKAADDFTPKDVEYPEGTVLCTAVGAASVSPVAEGTVNITARFDGVETSKTFNVNPAPTASADGDIVAIKDIVLDEHSSNQAIAVTLSDSHFIWGVDQEYVKDEKGHYVTDEFGELIIQDVSPDKFFVVEGLPKGLNVSSVYVYEGETYEEYRKTAILTVTGTAEETTVGTVPVTVKIKAGAVDLYSKKEIVAESSVTARVVDSNAFVADVSDHWSFVEGEVLPEDGPAIAVTLNSPHTFKDISTLEGNFVVTGLEGSGLTFTSAYAEAGENTAYLIFSGTAEKIGTYQVTVEVKPNAIQDAAADTEVIIRGNAFISIDPLKYEVVLIFDPDDQSKDRFYYFDPGTVLSPPPEPVREGYTFKGWFTDEENPKQVFIDDDSTLTVNSDLTLFAKWEPNTYNIKYENMEGASWAAGKEESFKTYTCGTELTLPTKNDVTKPGYTLAGWYDNEELNGSPIGWIDERTTGDVTLYAKWEVVVLHPIIEVSRKEVTQGVTTYTASVRDADSAVSYDGNYTVTYEWFVDGTKVEGSNSPEFTPTMATAGAYEIKCEATVSPNEGVAGQAVTVDSSKGSPIQYTVEITGTPTLKFAPVEGEKPARLTVDPKGTNLPDSGVEFLWDITKGGQKTTVSGYLPLDEIKDAESLSLGVTVTTIGRRDYLVYLKDDTQASIENGTLKVKDGGLDKTVELTDDTVIIAVETETQQDGTEVTTYTEGNKNSITAGNYIIIEAETGLFNLYRITIATPPNP